MEPVSNSAKTLMARRKESNLIFQQFAQMVDKRELLIAQLLKDPKSGKPVREFSFQLGNRNFSVSNVKGAIHYGEIKDTTNPVSLSEITKIFREAIAVYTEVEKLYQSMEAKIVSFEIEAKKKGSQISETLKLLESERRETKRWKEAFTKDVLPIQKLEKLYNEQKLATEAKDKELIKYKSIAESLKKKANQYEALGMPTNDEKPKSKGYILFSLLILLTVESILLVWKFTT